MRLVYQRIYAPLRDRTFHSLEELNAAIRPLLEEHNRRRFQRLPYSRWELFEQIERHTLAPLPPYHFPLQQIREVTVGFNYHVELREDRHHYSVPWQLRTRDPRTKVKLLYDERTVSIYYDNVRIAEYRRDRHPHAAAARVVCRVDPGTIPALGADARRQRLLRPATEPPAMPAAARVEHRRCCSLSHRLPGSKHPGHSDRNVGATPDSRSARRQIDSKSHPAILAGTGSDHAPLALYFRNGWLFSPEYAFNDLM